MEMRKTTEYGCWKLGRGENQRYRPNGKEKNNRGTTGKVEEYFPRHVQGLELRKNSRRTPEKLFGGPAEAKEPQKRHVQGSDDRNRYEGWLVGVRRGWRRKGVVGKWLTRPHESVREMQSPAGKMRLAGAWVVFWLRCFGKNWRSPPGAPCGVGKRRRRKSSPEKSPVVNVF